ncbi:MAG: glycoside hydrolase family 3 N-terminal domain-containing protein [Gordonia sp. (in: high G+C Gram-positive bacteria)]
MKVSSSAESAVSAPGSPTSASSTTAAAESCGAPELAKLTLRQKLAQRLMVGVTGAADARQAVTEEGIGGIFIGAWTDPAILTDGSVKRISASSKVPLMVSVDQEGGRVSRLAKIGIDFPSARAMVQKGMTPEQVQAEARKAGEAMAKLGITVDYAPSVDVSDQPDDAVIGDRSYSNDPEVVTRYAGAFAKGLQEAGIMPVYKHFPGHGHSSGDSHLGSVTTPPLSQLIEHDLVPYKTLLKDPGNAAVMMGHLIVPGLTKGDTPTSISARAIGMLRTGTRYGGPAFDGVIISDDLSGMKAITDRYSIDQAVLRAFQAGSDIGLWLSTDSVSTVLDTLESAVRSGKLNRAKVDASVVRILRAKGVLSC